MKKLIFLLCILALVAEVKAQVVTIASIKQNNSNGVPIDTGQIKTITGIVTVANELGGPSYIQDNTAGIAVFYNNFSQAVKIGDSVIVRSKLSQFNGLTELVYFNTGSDSSSFTIIDSNKTVTPVVITLQQFINQQWNGFEEYEGKLIRVNNVTFTTTGTFTGGTSGFNYNLIQSGTTYSSVLRIDNNVNIVGTVIPTVPVDIIGAGSQFKSAPPYNTGYQFFPRFVSDIVQPGPSFATNPVESNITPTSVALSWTTVSPGNTRVRFFKSDSLNQPVIFSDSVVNSAQSTNHSVNISNLIPGKIYYAEVTSTNTSGTSLFVKYFSTQSNPASTGKMEVYFNKSINPSLALPNNIANGNTDLKTRLIQRIDSAQYSIDIAMYSFNQINQIRDALINALIRGVKIRMVYDHRDGAAIQQLVQDLINVGIRVQQRPQSSTIMHNKFFIFDARNDNSFSDDWLWTGSSNITTDQFYSDAENVIFIQDQALCNTYTREFEEMWGSHNDINNPSQAKFGDQKADNTPHIFNIKGKRVECYFSPSDDASSKVENVIGNETHKSVFFCIFSFTRFQIANKMKTQFNPPSKMVRGVFDRDNNQNGSVYLEMSGLGGSIPWNPPAPVYLDNFNGLLHHKYILIDSDLPSSNPIVETGSMNFSNAATVTGNDENILLIYDSLIANQYYQEFAARYIEAGGTIGIQQISNEVPAEYSLDQNYPNPFNPVTRINFNLPKNEFVSLKVYDVTGRQIASLVSEKMNAGSYSFTFDAAGLSSGLYFYTLQSGSFMQTKKMLLVK